MKALYNIVYHMRDDSNRWNRLGAALDFVGAGLSFVGELNLEASHMDINWINTGLSAQVWET